jgi:hypothetical protein
VVSKEAHIAGDLALPSGPPLLVAEPGVQAAIMETAKEFEAKVLDARSNLKAHHSFREQQDAL